MKRDAHGLVPGLSKVHLHNKVLHAMAGNPTGCMGLADFGGTRIVDTLVGDPLPRIC